jgi:uncharacterized protein (TIGR02145 family)
MKKMKFLLIAVTIILCVAAESQTIKRIYQKNGTVIQIPINTIDSITYFNNNNVNQVLLTTLSIENITTNSATSGGSITYDGGSLITQRGICWATMQSPTTANNTILVGNGTGNFIANLSGLAENTTYYVRAYAINTSGIAYGNQLSFTTLQTPVNPGFITDASGNTYLAVTIGTQIWMAENLRTTKYRDGSNIPIVTDKTQWANNYYNSTTLPMMCWYDNNQVANNAYKFGALYNWYAVSPATNGNKNICPTGWHLPTDEDWTTLTAFLGGQSVAGGKMKTIGTQFWLSPNIDATNSSGFSGLPGGGRTGDGIFYQYASNGYWWSATHDGYTTSSNRNLFYTNGILSKYSSGKSSGHSVRCIKD